MPPLPPQLVEPRTEHDWSKSIWKFLTDSDMWVATGRERQLWDRTRVDVLTDKLALEIDWAKKWTEAVGQACWYATNTSKQAGIILLVKDKTVDNKYVYRCLTVATKLQFVLWIVETTTRQLIVDSETYTLPQIEKRNA